MDKQEEVRKLNLEIAKLTSARDTAASASKDAAAAMTEAQQRSDALSRRIQDLEAEQTQVARDLGVFLAECRLTLNVVHDAMRTAEGHARDLARRLDTLGSDITVATKNLEDIRTAAAQEGESISQKRADLDIYHARILRAAEEHLPGQKIVI